MMALQQQEKNLEAYAPESECKTRQDHMAHYILHYLLGYD
jgi:hypothetical protein